jgi:quercetin dioxygenase-like cupin family protein
MVRIVTLHAGAIPMAPLSRRCAAAEVPPDSRSERKDKTIKGSVAAHLPISRKCAAIGRRPPGTRNCSRSSEIRLRRFIMKAHARLSGTALVLLALAGSHASRAQDAAVVNAALVHVKLDNPRVRVLESVLRPGQKEKLHSHPASVIYIISGGEVRNHTVDGKSVDLEMSAGATIYRDPVTHWAENIGTTTIHLVLVELKDAK